MGLAGQGIPGFFWRFSGFSWWLSLLVEEQKNKSSTRFRGLSQRAEEKIKQFCQVKKITHVGKRQVWCWTHMERADVDLLL